MREAYAEGIDLADWLGAGLNEAAEVLLSNTKALLDTCQAGEKRDLLGRLMDAAVGEDDDS